MMTEQQLQEMEAWISEAACFSECDEQDEAALWSLITEVRRLQQANEDDTVLLGTVAGQRDAAMNAHADALGRIQDYILAADASAKERDAALAERDALKKEARRTQHEYVREMGFTNAYIKRCHALTAQLTEARRVLREVAAMLECHDKYRHYCPNCDRSVGTDDLMAKIAAVLAQDTDA